MATPPPPVGGGGAQGGGAAGGGAGGPTFPAHFGQQSAPAFGAGAFGAAADSDGATVDSLVSQFSEINTAFDHESTLRRFCEVSREFAGRRAALHCCADEPKFPAGAASRQGCK